MLLRIITFTSLCVGLLALSISLLGGGLTIWVGYAFISLAAVLALWMKWGEGGWGWELRETQRFRRARR